MNELVPSAGSACDERLPAALAFVHGGCHSAQSWHCVLSALKAQRPALRAFAVDLPGRGDIAGDLATLTLNECSESVTEQIRASTATDQPVVLIGHSLAGAIIPGVVNKLGAERISRIVFVACCVPPPGQSVLDTLPMVVRMLAAGVLRKPVIAKVPFLIERYVFGNKATPRQRARIRECMCRESAALIKEATAQWPSRLPRMGWILPIHDRAMPSRRQRSFIDSLGGADPLMTINAGHEVLITHPEDLAQRLLTIVDR